jgi:hypothetical protein
MFRAKPVKGLDIRSLAALLCRILVMTHSALHRLAGRTNVAVRLFLLLLSIRPLGVR